MSAPTAVSLTTTPEVSDLLAKLGVNPDYQKMLDRVRQVVPHLTHIDVELQERYELGAPNEPPAIIIRAFRSDPHEPGDTTREDLAKWKIETFPPEVWGQFQIRVLHGDYDAR